MNYKSKPFAAIVLAAVFLTLFAINNNVIMNGKIMSERSSAASTHTSSDNFEKKQINESYELNDRRRHERKNNNVSNSQSEYVSDEPSVLVEMKKIETENLSKSNEELRFEIYRISKILRLSAHKTHRDFTADEIVRYNELVRKKVVLQRILFNRTYVNIETAASKI